MKITRLMSREEYIFKKLRNRPRLEGRHVTDTIYCNVKAWGWARLGAAGNAPEFDDATLLRFLMGHGMEAVLAEGEVSQIETISPDSSDVGTVDVWLRDHPAEIKVTSVSTMRDIGEMDHWMQQLGEYVYRSTKRERNPWGELWVVHLMGDQGKKTCPEHGVPDEVVKMKHPDTCRARLACPKCKQFLSEGSRETALRCHRIDWTWEELDALHKIHKWRQELLQNDIEDAQYAIGNPPPIVYGYDFECPSCPVKELIGCPGRGAADDLEEKLAGSIMELQEVKT